MNTLPYWCLALKKAECLRMSKTNFAQSIAVFPNQTEVCAATVLTSCSFLGQNRKTEWWIKDTDAKEVKKKKVRIWKHMDKNRFSLSLSLPYACPAYWTCSTHIWRCSDDSTCSTGFQLGTTDLRAAPS